MTTKQIILLTRSAAFVLVCSVAFATGITPAELVWGLYVSGMVSGVVALMVPLLVLLFFPALERKLFPEYPEVEFSKAGRVLAAVFLLAILAGPFMLFMGAFTPFLAEAFEVKGMPALTTWLPTYWSWALREFWLMVAIFTGFSLYENALQIFRGSPMPFMRPWMLVLKMFVIVFLANFGLGIWGVVPLVALLQLPEETMARKLEEIGYRDFEPEPEEGS